MKKIGLLCLALVLALGTMGAGLAYWTETLEIGQNPVALGELEIEASVRPPSGEAWTGWSGSSKCKYCQFKTLSWDDEKTTLTVEVGNLYPGAQFGFNFGMKNVGSIPAKIKSVTLKNVSNTDLLPYVKAGGDVKHLGPEADWSGAWSHYGYWKARFNKPYSGAPCHLYGLLNDIGSNASNNGIADVLKDRILKVGDKFSFGGEDEADEGSTIVVCIDKDAPDSMELQTLKFDLVFTFTQFNAP